MRQKASPSKPVAPANTESARFALSRIKIENFRNFRQVDCQLSNHVVLFGENAAGKSNLLRALRLVLDPDLPDSERRLVADDFWSGGVPFKGTEISISVELTGFESIPSLLALLGDHIVSSGEGGAPVARLTYRYAPKETIPAEKRNTTGRDDYEFSIYGRDDPADEIDRHLRRYLVLRVLGALRDAEGDLRTWRRSPLRRLIEFVEPLVSPAQLEATAQKIDGAARELSKDPALDVLRGEVAKRLNEMIGSQHPLIPTLGFASTDPTRLLQDLRLYADERMRQLSETSLGLANAIYVALILLHADFQETEKEHAAQILAIEEPEAHLHPQLQRAVFRDLLSRERPVIVSTHSPNVASVTPLDALVLLRSNGSESVLVSLAAAGNFTAQQRADLQRYLDVTRAELLFARGVLLIEGDAEKYIVPVAAQLSSPPVKLDHLGISVCSVGGTDFIPYVKLLECFGIPWAVITDGDEGVPQDDNLPPGYKRALSIIVTVAPEDENECSELLAKDDLTEAVAFFAERGVFVGYRTLEADIAKFGGGPRLAQAFIELQPGARPATTAVFNVSGDLKDEQEAALIRTVERVGKGRFAQRLAEHLVASDIPDNVSDAIHFIAAKVDRRNV